LILCEENYPEILDEILGFLCEDDVELVFVDSSEMRKINFGARDIDKSTDVLSFPYEKVLHFPIGSVVINIDEVKEKAKFYGHTENDEISLLFLHGILHILGFDHETDSGQMREKECEVIEKFGLPKSLIVRVEN